MKAARQEGRVQMWRLAGSRCGAGSRGRYKDPLEGRHGTLGVLTSDFEDYEKSINSPTVE